MTDISIDDLSRSVRVRWTDGAEASFPFLWLRDNCPSGYHPETRERSFDLTGVPEYLAPETVRAENGALVIAWAPSSQGGAHVTRLPLDWLSAHRPGQRPPDPADIEPVPWRADLGAEGLPRAGATALLSDDTALADWMRATRQTGLSLVDGLAPDPDAGFAVARRIGFLRRTNFGKTFEVRSKPAPNNLAYTSERLPLHTDLPNQELPPGFQFLHCLENAATGGGSEFCDGFAVASDLASEAPDDFALLTRHAILFRFHDANHDIRRRQRVIRLNEDGAVEEVCFNAHLAEPFDLPGDVLGSYQLAYRRFMIRLRDPAYSLGLRLEPGQMVVFDNRRVLHGRAAFDPGSGARRLRGCYVDRGEFDSRLRVLSR